MNQQPCTSTDSEKALGRALKATSRTHVRRIALNYAAAHRAHPFTRVSDEFVSAVEINALQFIRDRINRHPSKGITLK